MRVNFWFILKTDQHDLLIAYAKLNTNDTIKTQYNYYLEEFSLEFWFVSSQPFFITTVDTCCLVTQSYQSLHKRLNSLEHKKGINNFIVVSQAYRATATDSIFTAQT